LDQDSSGNVRAVKLGADGGQQILLDIEQLRIVAGRTMAKQLRRLAALEMMRMVVVVLKPPAAPVR
jgi:hypothetical protein